MNEYVSAFESAVWHFALNKRIYLLFSFNISIVSLDNDLIWCDNASINCFTSC